MMRVWDADLLSAMNDSGLMQHDTVIADADYSTSGAIYDAFLAKYTSYGNYYAICAIIQNNDTRPNAVKAIYMFKGAATSGEAVRENDRYTYMGAQYEALMSAGSVIQIYYVIWDNVHDLEGQKPFNTFSDVTSKAYTLSTDIRTDFISNRVDNLTVYAAITFPKTDKLQNQYLREMDVWNCTRLAASYKALFLRYPNTIYAVSNSYAAKLSENEVVQTIVIDFNAWEDLYR